MYFLEPLLCTFYLTNTDWSSMAICYVYRDGGAMKTLNYAKKKGLNIIDLLEHK